MSDYTGLARRLRRDGIAVRDTKKWPECAPFFYAEDAIDAADALEAQAKVIEALRAALKDCADELEACIDEDYKKSDGSIVPEHKSKYERDMAPVIAARALLKPDDISDRMTIEEFRSLVERGFLIDYDGHGVGINKRGEVVYDSVRPSRIDEIPSDVVFIDWYNR
jgi:hypothetical protein